MIRLPIVRSRTTATPVAMVALVVAVAWGTLTWTDHGHLHRADAAPASLDHESTDREAGLASSHADSHGEAADAAGHEHHADRPASIVVQLPVERTATVELVPPHVLEQDTIDVGRPRGPPDSPVVEAVRLLI